MESPDQTNNSSAKRKENLDNVWYGRKGKSEGYSSKKNGENFEEAVSVVDMLIDNEFISNPNTLGEKKIVYIPAANDSPLGDLLQRVLGKEYTVVSGDLRNIDRKKYRSDFQVQADAFYPPLALESVDVIIDRQGAMWHATQGDHASRETKDTEELFDACRKILKKGGVLLVDKNTAAEVSTTRNIDAIFKDIVPIGYNKPYDVNNGNLIYRVYRKI